MLEEQPPGTEAAAVPRLAESSMARTPTNAVIEVFNFGLGSHARPRYAAM